MGSIIYPSLIRAIWIPLLAVQLVLGQSVSPTNSTNPANSTVRFILDTTVSMMQIQPNIEPLTDQAGLQGSLSTLETINPQGPLVLTTTRTVDSLEPGDIAFISCEPSDYTADISSQRTINLAVNNKPYAIVLYSIYATSCSFSPTDDFSFTYIYTMLSANASETVMAGLQRNDPPFPTTSIHVNQNTVNGSSGGSDENNLLGKSPTTAVAMIILYSITGIITALFLAIIVVGAIRAHRHPERYGPRRVIGRPRQSRAKGIARAMLETLPIVKFGDLEEDKAPERGGDVELANTAGQHSATAIDPEHPERTRDYVATSTSDAAAAAGPEVVTTEAASGSAYNKDGEDGTNNGLACSVCTDDFLKGQDIRVLPCKHKFHPECIDPWLLNVSGTCPLCRVDLHPTTSSMDDLDAEDAESEASPHNAISPTSPDDALNAETTRHNRRSCILHIGRMRHATPDERIEALRRLRNENRNRATDANVEEGGWSVGERTLNRIGARISRPFGFSRALGGSRPTSGISASESRPVSQAPAASTTMEAPSPIAEGRSHTEEVPTTSPIAEAHPPPERHVTNMEPPAATTTEAAAEPPALETNPQGGSSSVGR